MFYLKVRISTSPFDSHVNRYKKATNPSTNYRPINDRLPANLNLQCKIQWENSRNTIFGHNFWLECPMKIHFEGSFQGYPTCLFFLCHLPSGRLATWCAKTIGEWGIPEKSFQHVAQLRWNYHCGTLQSKVMAKNHL